MRLHSVHCSYIPSALGTAAGAEVECLRVQGQPLDKFPNERTAVGTEHTDVQLVSLYVVKTALCA